MMSSKAVRHLLARAALVAASLAVAGGATAAADGVRFHMETSLQAFPFGSCAGFSLATAGTVKGTHIGQGSWSGTECVGATDTGQAALTAADGAQLFLTFAVITSAPPDANGLIYPRGTFTITGGTGRFAGSSGGGTLTAIASVVTFTAQDTLEGTIRLGPGDA